MPEPLHVVAAVIEDDGRILACRRRAGKADAGKWEFPGGKIEPGETPAAALVREIREELDLAIEVRGELTTDDTQVGERMIRLTCLTATLTSARPDTSTDHDALLWATRDELPGLDWAAPDLPAVALLTGSTSANALPERGALSAPSTHRRP